VVEPVVLGPEEGPWPPEEGPWLPEDAALLQEGLARAPPPEGALLQLQNAELLHELVEAHATGASLLEEQVRLQRQNAELRRLLNGTRSAAANATGGTPEIQLPAQKHKALAIAAICLGMVLLCAGLCLCALKVAHHRHLAQRQRARLARGQPPGPPVQASAVADAFDGCAECCGVFCSAQLCATATVVVVLWGGGLAVMWFTGSLQPVLKEVGVYAYLGLGMVGVVLIVLAGVVMNARAEMQQVSQSVQWTSGKLQTVFGDNPRPRR